MFDGSWWTMSNDGFLFVNFYVVSSYPTTRSSKIQVSGKNRLTNVV